MRVDDIFVFEDLAEQGALDEREQFVGEMVSEGYASTIEEAELLLESRAAKVIRDYSAKYSAGEPPEIMVLQDRTSPSHYVILGAGSGMFYRFDVINDKVVSEERFRDFKELLEEKKMLTMATFGQIDHRSYLRKNWKKILMWIVGGSVVLLGGALLLGWLATFATAIAHMAKIMGGVSLVAGVGWIMQQFDRNAPSDSQWNASGR